MKHVGVLGYVVNVHAFKFILPVYLHQGGEHSLCDHDTKISHFRKEFTLCPPYNKPAT
jgi:hypothetical protein